MASGEGESGERQHNNEIWRTMHRTDRSEIGRQSTEFETELLLGAESAEALTITI